MSAFARSSPLTAGRRRARRPVRFARALSLALILFGLLMLVDVGLTLAWQEPVTALIAMLQRDGVNRRYLSLHTAPLSPREQRALAALPLGSERIAFLARREAHQLERGDGAGTLLIPKLGRFDFVQGTDTVSLEKGPGHYPGTALPGLGRTVAIAGHRTTWLAPFRHLDALRPGDWIVVEMPYGRFTYIVQQRRIVAPEALWITHNVGYDRLVLSACNPLYSATQRIAVFARLRSVAASRDVRR